ncbi:hypothetical protein O181_013358 [Austropuccinia psidii MF-1]|uniref:Uncharacterized protein n=1 Tax=Austropuccinia psidii MF-1 TaxID=1389203 RepID=A0A9Q3BYJ2_9BASI|nr:hypothetical protein [Austropuccinia psidii MF-1]
MCMSNNENCWRSQTFRSVRSNLAQPKIERKGARTESDFGKKFGIHKALKLSFERQTQELGVQRRALEVKQCFNGSLSYSKGKHAFKKVNQSHFTTAINFGVHRSLKNALRIWKVDEAKRQQSANAKAAIKTLRPRCRIIKPERSFTTSGKGDTNYLAITRCLVSD